MKVPRVISVILLVIVAIVCASEDQSSFLSKITNFFLREKNIKLHQVGAVTKKLDEGAVKTLIADAQGINYISMVF